MLSTRVLLVAAAVSRLTQLSQNQSVTTAAVIPQAPPIPAGRDMERLAIVLTLHHARRLIVDDQSSRRTGGGGWAHRWPRVIAPTERRQGEGRRCDPHRCRPHEAITRHGHPLAESDRSDAGSSSINGMVFCSYTIGSSPRAKF